MKRRRENVMTSKRKVVGEVTEKVEPLALAIEALVSGIPVVASRVGGLPELVEDGTNGILFTPGDEASLVNALCELLGDLDRARSMGRSSREKVAARFDIGRMTADYHRHFIDCLARHRFALST